MCFLDDTMRRRSDKVKVLYGLFSLMDAHAQFSVKASHEMGRSISHGGVIGYLAGCVAW